jgi:hypothetical protein
MKKIKEFDCVRMKDEIQAKLLKEYEGLSDEQIAERRRKKIEADPVLGPIYKQMRTVGRA